MKQSWRRILAIAAILLIGLFVAELPGCMSALGPKTGRIIDHDTGQGIAGADVVVSGWYRQNGLWREINFCTYVALTKTDENGDYSFPSEYSHWTWSPSASNPENYWIVYASKDGYVKGDTKWPLQYAIDGTPVGLNTWVSTSNSATRHGMQIQIPPIELMQVNMTLKQRIAYFSETGLTKNCSDDLSYLKPMQHEVHRFYASVTSTICSSPENDTIESSIAGYLSNYADDKQAFVAAWRDLDPQLTNHLLTSSSQLYRMADVCSIAKAGGENKVR